MDPTYMVSTVILGILGLIALTGGIYLYTLVIKALKKYINSDKVTDDTAATTK